MRRSAKNAHYHAPMELRPIVRDQKGKQAGVKPKRCSPDGFYAKKKSEISFGVMDWMFLPVGCVFLSGVRRGTRFTRPTLLTPDYRRTSSTILLVWFWPWLPSSPSHS
jgi:hypothetical protein